LLKNLGLGMRLKYWSKREQADKCCGEKDPQFSQLFISFSLLLPNVKKGRYHIGYEKNYG
jgi:hypothetical protein